jgi:hypothetical protein
MKNYSFLIKPIFFIFNLLFATWLVIKIEQLSPSDFGKNKSLFERSQPRPDNIPVYDKYYLKKLADDYKSGKLDSAAFDLQLEIFIDDARKKVTVEKAN